MLPDYAQYLSPVWSRYTNLVVDHASGPYLYTTEGRRILDFSTGIGVTGTGHCHSEVVKAAQAQLEKLMHGQINIVYHQPVLDLVKELLTVVPPHLNRFFFSNSGAEAVEASIKLARHATGRPNIIVFQGSFHGRTIGTMSLTTSNTIYRVGYQPLMSGVFVAPYPYAYYYGWSDEETIRFCLRELKLLLKTQTAPQETAAILIEPLLGEGGYVVPPVGFLKGVEEICREHDILFIADEVQSGFGRTGKWFAHQYEDVQPDIMVMAKGLGSGLPISGIAARAEVMDKWIAGSHGGTYTANAVSCAAAAATVRVMRDENLIENSRVMGELLINRLKEVQQDFSCIGDVRGRGLMIATEFTAPDGEPDTHQAKLVWKYALENDLLLLTCGPYGNVIRWIPPLVINEEHIEEALQKFQAALDRAAA